MMELQALPFFEEQSPNNKNKNYMSSYMGSVPNPNISKNNKQEINAVQQL